jgi:hypothetical protein
MESRAGFKTRRESDTSNPAGNAMTNKKVVRQQTVVKGCFSSCATGCKNHHVDAMAHRNNGD